MFFELLLQDKDYTFARGASRRNLKLKTKRSPLSINDFIQNSVSVRIFPTGLSENGQRFVWVVRVVVKSFVILRAKEKNRTINYLPKAEQERLDHLPSIGQVSHRLTHPLIHKDRIFIVPTDIRVTRREVLQFLEFAFEPLAVGTPGMLYDDKSSLTQHALIQRVALFRDKADLVAGAHLRLDDRVEIHRREGCIH